MGPLAGMGTCWSSCSSRRLTTSWGTPPLRLGDGARGECTLRGRTGEARSRSQTAPSRALEERTDRPDGAPDASASNLFRHAYNSTHSDVDATLLSLSLKHKSIRA